MSAKNEKEQTHGQLDPNRAAGAYKRAGEFNCKASLSKCTKVQTEEEDEDDVDAPESAVMGGDGDASA